MDIIAQVISPYIGTGEPGVSPYRSKITTDYPSVTANDITGTDTALLIPPVNAVILEIITDEQTYQAIAADYTIIAAEEVQPVDGQ